MIFLCPNLLSETYEKKNQRKTHSYLRQDAALMHMRKKQNEAQMSLFLV